jgi:hypothetical protein
MSSRTTRPLYGAQALGKVRGALQPSIIYFDDSLGYTWALWMDNAGTLRRAEVAAVEAPGFDWNAAGTPVMQQIVAAKVEEKVAEKVGPKVVPPLPTSGKPEKSA